MTDYSKPTTLACSRCRTEVHSVIDHDGEGICVMAALDCECPGDTLLIPVFAVIPEDERPKTHEPRARDVCIGNEDGVDVVAVSWGGDSRRAYSEQDQRGQIEGWSHAQRRPWGVLWEGRSRTLADAVLWVAEGKR